MPYVIGKGTRCKVCRADVSDRWRWHSTRKRLVFQNYNRARYGECLFHASKWLIWVDDRFVERLK
ncbi:MAG TPA: hypothetical protein P5307_24150 [Pirellulaceae bacterium]|nr:hypothetical protein [Planctomycetales bacterium]MCB9938674.1 hypothetical protein [Planctomycetaceae bacterium]HRX82189.1 hypothetical protein [Pirellulaceae bacterium]